MTSHGLDVWNSATDQQARDRESAVFAEDAGWTVVCSGSNCCALGLLWLLTSAPGARSPGTVLTVDSTAGSCGGPGCSPT